MADVVPFPAAQAGGRLCVDCEEQIDPKRVRARPDTRRCLPCQRLRELQIRDAEIGSGDRGIIIIKG